MGRLFLQEGVRDLTIKIMGELNGSGCCSSGAFFYVIPN